MLGFFDWGLFLALAVIPPASLVQSHNRLCPELCATQVALAHAKIAAWTSTLSGLAHS